MTETSESARVTRVLLSYSRVDEAAVIKLAADLEETGDIEVLRDKDDILPAEDWQKRLGGLVLSADALVFCLSPTHSPPRKCGVRAKQKVVHNGDSD